MFHIVYKTTRTDTGEYYIGVHSCTDLDDGYLGSGDRIKRSIVKYGREAFDRIIIATCPTREEALLIEHELVTVDMLADPLCLNISIGGKGNPNGGHTITEDTKRSLSQLHTGKTLSTTTRERIRNAKKGQPSSLKGVPRSEETKAKISASRKGNIVSEETREKIRQTRLGVPRDAATREKIRQANIGRIHTEDSKTKMRKPKELTTCPNCGQVGGVPQMKRWHFDNCTITSSS